MTTPPPYQPQQPYPGPYGPPPPKKGMSTGAIVAITLGSIFGAIILIGAMAASGDTTDGKAGAKPTTVEVPAAQPSKAAPAKKTQAPAEPAEKAPVTLTAKKATFTPSVLHQGGAFTSVKVTITNNGTEKISVNPLYFTITDTDGSKHQAELGQDKNQIDTMDLEPGEKTTGIITGKGKFTPKYVTYVDGLFGEGIRGTVS